VSSRVTITLRQCRAQNAWPWRWVRCRANPRLSGKDLRLIGAGTAATGTAPVQTGPSWPNPAPVPLRTRGEVPEQETSRHYFAYLVDNRKRSSPLERLGKLLSRPKMIITGPSGLVQAGPARPGPAAGLAGKKGARPRPCAGRRARTGLVPREVKGRQVKSEPGTPPGPARAPVRTGPGLAASRVSRQFGAVPRE
jgi:hypothetical protein